MKKNIPTFVAGMLTMALVGGIGVTAFAATGQLTITVDPINIQVNGATFQPKNEKGEDVPVFAYNGSTYAPLRALAEAYGLEVGYDAQTNMATVTGDVAAPGGTPTPAPDTTTTTTDYSDWTAEEEAAYQEFKGMWDVEINKHVDGVGTSYHATYCGELGFESFRASLLSLGEDKFSTYACRLLDEQSLETENEETIMFWSNEPRAVIARADFMWQGDSVSAFFTDSFKGGN